MVVYLKRTCFKIPLLLLSAILSFSIPANAERLPIKTYTTAEGLPRDHITNIMQDSRGFLWFSTTEGLSRFDGLKFVNYGTEQGLADRVVNDFIETRAGNYWVATENGLCRFVPDAISQTTSSAGKSVQRFVTYYPAEDAGARLINVLLQDSDGNIWCGTNAGLFRFNDGGTPAFTPINVDGSQPAVHKPVIRAMIQDHHGMLWIVADSGLFTLKPDGTAYRYTRMQGLPENILSTLLEDKDGRIWVGSTQGLYELVSNPEPERTVVGARYTTRDGLANDNIKSLRQSADGKLWVGTWVGLSTLFPATGHGRKKFRKYDKQAGLSDLEITALYGDREGNLWAGTEAGGAMKVAANGLTTYGEPDGMKGSRVGSIFNDRAGNLCVITGPWLNVASGPLDHPVFKAIDLALPKGIRLGSWGWYQITFQDSAGQWWMNTGGGLVRYPRLARIEDITHTPPETIYTVRDGLGANEVFRLFEDSRHDIWISTLGNSQAVLARWERATGTFHRYSPADGIPEAAPTAFCEDGSGNLWIGFYDGSLVRYKDGRFRQFSRIGGIQPGCVRALYLDSAKRIWIATAELGAVCIDDPGAVEPAFRTYSTAQGLSSTQATSVTEDRWGMIYVGTGRGVDKLDPKTGRIRHLTEADGLSNSFVNVSFRDGDGSLWFGTLNGLSRLVPTPERPTAPPAILITGLRISGATFPVPELGAASVTVPELEAGRNNIQIDFAGLTLSDADSLRYQFKLEGALSEWSAPFNERVARFPNLAPGSYRFLVRAVSPAGIASEKPAVLSFYILPPFWQRLWFRALVVIFAVTCAGLITFYRKQRIKAAREAQEDERRRREERLAELERVRTRIATDLHDDIGSSLSQIRLLSEVARQRLGEGNEALAEPLTMISNASHEVVSSMSDIVWAINPRKDHLSDLGHRMRRFASDVFAAREIDLQFNAPDTDSDVRVGADIRREVFLIFKESVNNIVRHSGCTQASIDLRIANRSIWLTISDNGRGFDISKCDEGHGLESLRERAKIIGGKLEILSKEDAGTTVSLQLEIAPLFTPP